MTSYSARHAHSRRSSPVGWVGLRRPGEGRRGLPGHCRRRPVGRRRRSRADRRRRTRRRPGDRCDHRPLGPRRPTATVSLPLQSFAGTTGENAEALAQAHPAYDATLPPVPAGDLVKVEMVLKDMVVEIAPGVKYNTWAFDGHGAPGPVVHVREGQKVEMTLTNGGSIPHSIDFHAARIAPNVAFRDVAPGESFTFRSTRATPASSCTTAARSPSSRTSRTACTGRSSSNRRRRCRKADREYVLVASEWYLNGDGIAKPASLDMAKARATEADWTTFNGYANQYVTHPLTARPGRDRAPLRRRGRPDARHRLPRRRDDLRPRLGERRHDAVPAAASRRLACRPAAARYST